MGALDDFRQQNPAYTGVPDAQLADGLYNKFYSSMPREQFNAKIGFAPEAPQAPMEFPTARTFGKGVEQGIGDPVVGGSQLLARVANPDLASATDRATAAREAQIQASRPNQYRVDQSTDLEGRTSHQAIDQGKGFDAARTLGNIIGTLPAAFTLGPVAAGAAGGALTPVTQEGNFWRDKAVQTGAGAAAGAAGKVVGGAIAPNIRPQAQTLLEAGGKLTPGMLGGRIAKTVEDKLTSIPGAGEVIGAGQRNALGSFNIAAINQALGQIGESLPKGTKAGTAAVAEAGDRISDAYKRVLPKVTMQADQQFKTDMASLQKQLSFMPPDQQTQFLKILNDRVASRFQGGQTASGDVLQEVRSELRDFARKYGKSTDGAQQQLADAVQSVDMFIGDAIARQNPNLAPQLKAADSAWARLVRIEGAAAQRSKSEGIFTPGDLLAAVKGADSSTRHRAFARGDALMQELATAAENVMGSKYPDSGTGGRLLQATPQGFVAGAAALPFTAMHTPPGIFFMNQWASPGAARSVTGQGARAAGSLLAPATGGFLRGD